MKLTSRRQRVATQPGVASVRRPIQPGSDEQFDLYYVRSGPLSAHPILIIPGGPGMASIQLYRGLRQHGAALGLDIVMVEHRGVGMSRCDDTGADLPGAALTIDQAVDDLAAVLDRLGIERAVVYGSSYGSYLAAGLGVRHPERVQSMVLDSPVLSAADIDAIRAAVRGLLLTGDGPGAGGLSDKVLRLLDAGMLDSYAVEVAATAYGLGGTSLLNRMLTLRLSGHHLLWQALTRFAAMSTRKVPYHNEIDLVGQIAFRELDYPGQPDGEPLDPSPSMTAIWDHLAGPKPEFQGEPFDLPTELPRFSWPTVVISGQRDLTTPPSIAHRVSDLIPDATLLELATMPHSALDSREPAALRIAQAVARGQITALPARAEKLDALPGNTSVRLVAGAVQAAAVVERIVPGSKRALTS